MKANRSEYTGSLGRLRDSWDRLNPELRRMIRQRTFYRGIIMEMRILNETQFIKTLPMSIEQLTEIINGYYQKQPEQLKLF